MELSIFKLPKPEIMQNSHVSLEISLELLQFFSNRGTLESGISVYEPLTQLWNRKMRPFRVLIQGILYEFQRIEDPRRSKRRDPVTCKLRFYVLILYLYIKVKSRKKNKQYCLKY